MIGSKRTAQKGFSLFIAVILSAAAASITLSLATLAYKSLLLSSTALESQYAFYAADTALECALYYDNGLRNAFPYTVAYGTTGPYNCGGVSITFTSSRYNAYTTQYVSNGSVGNWFTVNGVDCARITVYKTDGSQPLGQATGSLFGDGANVACASLGTDPRAIERGIQAYY